MSEVTTTASRVVYRNRWMEVREDDFIRADGSIGLYGVVHKADFALVIPMDDTGFHLVEQYRYPAGGRYWEFPQGTWEDAPDADLAEVARGELAEETGLQAGSLRALGAIHECYGITGQRGHVFVATSLVPGAPNLGPEEGDLRHAHVPFDEFPRMVAAGRITDAATLAAYALLLLERGAAVTAPA
jgi:8-oxo-dGTP pyrophosphatase MutT (NUDIX family)